jgi:hypothetical protein
VRVIINDDAGDNVAVFDVDDRSHTVYPADVKQREHLIKTLTEVLRYLLRQKKGLLDSEYP